MSHSRFPRVEAYTETRMASSFRQARYDYWQDQSGVDTAIKRKEREHLRERRSRHPNPSSFNQ